jgi:hypothetical protein
MGDWVSLGVVKEPEDGVAMIDGMHGLGRLMIGDGKEHRECEYERHGGSSVVSD